MRRHRFMGVILFILFFNLGAVSMAQTPLGPRMALEEYSYNFMEVHEGTILEHSFMVANKGDQPLEIKRVNPS